MQPIVNGLQEEYGDQVDFVSLNATDGAEGEAAFEFYGLRGHPALIWVEPDGSVPWMKIGPTSLEDLDQAIQESLDK